MTGSLLHHLFNLPGRKNLTDDACRARLLLKIPCIHYSLPPPPPPPPHDTASSTLSPTVIILIAVLSSCFLLLGYYAVILKLCSRWRCSRAAAAGAEDDAVTDHDLVTAESDRDSVSGVNFVWYIHTVGLDQSVITSITVCKYKKEEGLVDGTDCSVCLAEFREDEDLRLLPKCGHAFHVPCIDTWLASHVNCPLCRAAVVVLATNHPAAPSEVLQVAVDMESPQYEANSAATAVQISSPESTEDLEAGHVTSRVPSWTSDLAGNNNIERVQESSTSVSGEDAQALHLQRSVSVELSVLSDSIRRQHEELRDQDEKLDRCSCSGRWMKVMSSSGKRGRGRRIAMKRCCSNGGSLFLARHSKSRIYSSSLLPI